GGAVIGSQVSLGLGASWDALPLSWLTVGAELHALFDVDVQTRQAANPAASIPTTEASGRPLIPAEWLVSLRNAYLYSGKLAFTAAAGGLVPTGPTTSVTAPLVRAIASIAFIP